MIRVIGVINGYGGSLPRMRGDDPDPTQLTGRHVWFAPHARG